MIQTVNTNQRESNLLSLTEQRCWLWVTSTHPSLWSLLTKRRNFIIRQCWWWTRYTAYTACTDFTTASCTVLACYTIWLATFVIIQLKIKSHNSFNCLCVCVCVCVSTYLHVHVCTCVCVCVHVHGAYLLSLRCLFCTPEDYWYRFDASTGCLVMCVL